MQVYKAWSVASNRASGEGLVTAAQAHTASAAQVVLPPITLVVRQPKPPARKAPSLPCPLTPPPSLTQPCALKPRGLTTQPCSPEPLTQKFRLERPRLLGPEPVPSPLGPRGAEPAAPDARDAWLRRAVTSCLAAPDLGSEGLATLLAGRLDDNLARSLYDLRDSGQLVSAVDSVLRKDGLERRADLPLESIISSALRRHTLRPWLAAVADR